MLDLHRLILLREVKLRGSMTAAARSLSYTHSTISQQLNLLQREAGVPLLEREGRGVRLTAAAERLVRNTETILTAMERAEAELASTDDHVRGRLSLAGFGTVSHTVVPHAIAEIGREHPALQLSFEQLEPEEALLRLAIRKVDIVITDRFPDSPPDSEGNFSAQLLAQDRVRAYLPEDHRAQNARPEDFRWVLEPRGAASHNWALRTCRATGFEPHVAYESPDLLFHLRMVESGLAAAFLPDLVVRDFGSTLRHTDLLASDECRTLHLVTRNGYENRPAVQVIAETFRRLLA